MVGSIWRTGSRGESFGCFYSSACDGDILEQPTSRARRLECAESLKNGLVAVVKCGEGCAKRWCHAIGYVLTTSRTLALRRDGPP